MMLMFTATLLLTVMMMMVVVMTTTRIFTVHSRVGRRSFLLLLLLGFDDVATVREEVVTHARCRISVAAAAATLASVVVET